MSNKNNVKPKQTNKQLAKHKTPGGKKTTHTMPSSCKQSGVKSFVKASPSL